MALKLPEAVKPIGALVVHLAIGAAMIAIMLVIELALAGFVQLLGSVPFAPAWLREATEPIERALFAFDLVVVGLFLLAEFIKLAKALWKEVRHG